MASSRTTAYHPRPYWRSTRIQMLMCALLLCVALPFMPHVLTKLNGYSLFGFQLGYFAVSHGFVVAGCLIVSWFVRRQGRIDRRFGTHEDF